MEWIVYNATYSKENKKQAEKIIDLICHEFGVFTKTMETRFRTEYNKESNRFKVVFIGTKYEYDKLCKIYWLTNR